MDAALKEDIAKEFRHTYYAEEKKKESGFWQFFHKANRLVDRLLNRIYLDIPSFAVVSTALLVAAAPPLASLALCFWAADAGLGLYSNIACKTRAEGRIWKDIESGLLPEKYNDVIDGRIQGLNKELELYNAQKAQLPPRGSVKTAFVEAANAAEQAAPVAVPAAVPAAPKA